MSKLTEAKVINNQLTPEEIQEALGNAGRLLASKYAIRLPNRDIEYICRAFIQVISELREIERNHK